MARPAQNASSSLTRELVEFFVAGALLLTLSALTVPHVGSVAIVTEKGDVSTTLPMKLGYAKPGTEKRIRFAVDLRPGNSHLIRLSARDCVKEVSVNGSVVATGLCSVVYPHLDINLATSGRTGKNIVEAKIIGLASRPMTFDVSVSPQDSFALALRLMRFAWIAAAAAILIRRLLKADTALLIIGLFGIGLRGAYVFTTIPGDRSHDFDGHVDYLLYAARHFLDIPPASGQSWEFFQPPLYYWLLSPVVRMAEMLGWTTSTGIELIQDASLMISALTLIAGLWIGTLLFRKTERRALLLYALLLAASPAWLICSSGVSNDPLVLLLSVTGFGLTLLFWQRPFSPTLLYAAVAIFALGFLTKANALTVAPALALCLTLKSDVSRREKIRQGIGCALIFLALTAWYPAVRMLQGKDDAVRTFTFGTKGINPMLKLELTPKNFFTFHPGLLVMYPFATPNAENIERKSFWEFFFRSSLFGEFYFPRMQNLASVVTMSALLLLPWMFIGFLRETRSNIRKTLPLVAATVLLFGTAIAYVVMAPYIPDQDFRFSALLVVPLTYYVVRGIVASRKGFAYAGTCVALFFVGLSALFYVLQ